MLRKKKEIVIEPKLFRQDPLTDKLSDVVDEKWTKNKFVLLTPSAGVGKTFVTIDAVGKLPGGKNAHFLIFGPKAKKLDHSWDASILGYNVVKDTTMTFSVNTHDYIRTHPDDIIAEAAEYHNNGHAVVLVLDEVHLVKNPTSKVGKALKKITDNQVVDLAIGLSATPYSNSYLDTVGYLVLNHYYENKTDFVKHQIMYFDDYHQPMVKNKAGEVDRNLFLDPDFIDKALSEFTADMPLKKSPLPPASFEERTFDLNNDPAIKFVHPAFAEFGPVRPRTQRGNYNAIKNKFYKEGYYESAIESTSVQRSMITNIAQRANILIDILSEIRKSNDPHPVLIFYQNNIELDTIKSALEKTTRLSPTTVNIVNGKQKDLEDVTDPNTVVAIQYKAGGAAIEFPHAYSSIYFMPTYSYENYKQTLGRNRRNGMTHPVKYYKIIANNTLDDYIWHTILDNKKSFSNKTMEQVMMLQSDVDDIDVWFFGEKVFHTLVFLDHLFRYMAH